MHFSFHACYKSLFLPIQDYDAEKDDVDYYDEEEDEEEEEEEDYEGAVEGEDDDDDEEDAGSVAVLPRPVGFNEPGVDSGSTACVAFLLPELSSDEKGELARRVFLYVANAGDSRAVLCRGGAAVELSEDHKPEDPSERARIQAAGGTVTADGRVNDGLNLSRAIGDHVYKVCILLERGLLLITEYISISLCHFCFPATE